MMTTEPTRCHAGRCARMGRAGPGLCPSCTSLSGRWLAELPALVAALSDEPEEPPDVAYSPVHDWTWCQTCLRWVAGLMPRGRHDVLLAAGPVRTSTGPRVSGSGETPLPGGADRLSWLARAADVHHDQERCSECQHAAVCQHERRCFCGHMTAQTGAVPVAAELAGWAKLAAEELGVTVPPVGRVVAGPYGPIRRTASEDVAALCRFLAIQHDRVCRLDWADDYAEAVHDLWVYAMVRTGRFDGRPEPMDGVPCPFPDCNRMALVRRHGEDGRFCDPADGGCGRTLTEEEYTRWTRLEAHWAKEAGMSYQRFKVGQRVRMPGVPFVLDVLEVRDGCGDEGCDRQSFRFKDPETGEDDWMHSDEFELAR